MNILHKLRQTNSRLEKEQILKSATPLEQKMFMFAYNPHKMYYQNFDDIDYNSIKTLREDTFHILDDIENRVHVGHKAREIIEQHSYYHGDLIKLICNKDLDCGVTEVTLNKVFGKDFIPTFNVQLAKEVPFSKIKFPILGQVKYDGVRCLAFISAHGVILKTRNGKVFSYPMLEKYLTHFYKGTDIIFDGELVYGHGHIIDRTSVSGIVNSAIRGTPIPHDKGILFNVFDKLYLPEFVNQVCRRPYAMRLNELEGLFISMSNLEVSSSLFKYVNLVHSTTLYNLDELNNYYSSLISIGCEGLILKSHNHLYTFKRSADWIKVKETKTTDLLCLAVQEGKGKYAGGIGALICVGVVEGKDIQVAVGSGLTDEERMYAGNTYVGATIEVKYNSVIKDSKTDEWSLFLPRFVCVREDK